MDTLVTEFESKESVGKTNHVVHAEVMENKEQESRDQPNTVKLVQAQLGLGFVNDVLDQDRKILEDPDMIETEHLTVVDDADEVTVQKCSRKHVQNFMVF
jgi:hypothetical protein